MQPSLGMATPASTVLELESTEDTAPTPTAYSQSMHKDEHGCALASEETSLGLVLSLYISRSWYQFQ